MNKQVITEQGRQRLKLSKDQRARGKPRTHDKAANKAKPKEDMHTTFIRECIDAGSVVEADTGESGVVQGVIIDVDRYWVKFKVEGDTKMLVNKGAIVTLLRLDDTAAVQAAEAELTAAIAAKAESASAAA